MSTSIFNLGSDNKLTEMRRADYGSEDVLQKLLADHPAVLSAAAGRKGRLILVRREQAVSDQANGAARFSLDHLFLDGEGVPVLAEVKRASDTRTRREVVAQMLDYAANGVAYWTIDGIIAAYRATTLALDHDLDADLEAFLDGGDAEIFWRQVESNLGSGRIRMLFVADHIPKELTRIVEFMNEQMRPAEVLAIEVEHYLGSNGIRTLVPRLVGATARAQTAKSVEMPVEPVTENEWLASLPEEGGQGALEGAQRVIIWLRQEGFRVELTKSQDALAAGVPSTTGRLVRPFYIRRSGWLDVALMNLKSVRSLEPESARQRFLDRLQSLPTAQVRTTGNLNGWTSVRLEDFLKDGPWSEFQSVASDIKEAIVQSSSK